MLRALGPLRKTPVAGALFAVLAIYLASMVPTIEVAWVMAFLLLTVFLFAFEVVRWTWRRSRSWCSWA
jgi:ABC-type transport system involved in multi-copper enzyme maturation permease subunit